MRKNFGRHGLSSLSRTLLDKLFLGSNSDGKLCRHAQEGAKVALALTGAKS